MKKKRFALIVIFLISVVIAPFALVFGFAFGMPCQYQETYLAALADKYELLKKTNEKKIIIIGGSSVPFGLNSELVEQHLPYKVVDFGLYASLGTKVMLDLAKVNINEGDIIVIAPEVHPQLMSLHFDPLIMLQCLDSSWEMFNNLTYQDKQKVLASVPTFSGEKYQYFSKRKVMHLEGVYQRSSFNEHGDISYDRPYNQMAMLYDPNMKIEINSKIISDDFFDYLNNFANYCTKKKASIYYSFSPLNELAISNSKIDNFFETLFQKLDFEIISRLEDYIFDAGYFYDSNFHLNNAGSILRTRQLIIDLKRTLGDSSETDIEIPEIPTVPSNSEGEDSKTAHMFEYKSINGGLELSSLKEEYKDEISLELPSFAEGQKVLSVGKEAFSTSLAVTSITVPHGYSLFMSGAFSNCPTLKKVYLKSSDPSSIQVGLSGFLDGASKDIKFIVPYDSYGAYVTNYFWGNYSEYIDTEEGF